MPKQNLKEFAEAYNTFRKTVTKDEFTEAFKALNLFVRKAKEMLEEKTEAGFEAKCNELKELVNGLESDLRTSFNELVRKVESKIASIKDGKNGRDGIDGKNGTNGLNGRDGVDGRDGKDTNEAKIISTLHEGLLSDMMSEMTNMEKRLEGKVNLSRPRGTIGGLISQRIRFIDDETPTGTVNGVNTIFTLVAKSPEAGSLKVFVNGQRMRVTDDYTLSGKTITFVTAPPTNSIILCDYRF